MEDKLRVKNKSFLAYLVSNDSSLMYPQILPPQPSLEIVNQSRIAFMNALVASKTGNKQVTIHKKECRAILEKQLELLGLSILIVGIMK